LEFSIEAFHNLNGRAEITPQRFELRFSHTL
jgi:hypothetical protein